MTICDKFLGIVNVYIVNSTSHHVVQLHYVFECVPIVPKSFHDVFVLVYVGLFHVCEDPVVVICCSFVSLDRASRT